MKKSLKKLFLAGATGTLLVSGLGAVPVSASESGADTFTYAIGGDPGANVNSITSTDRWSLMTSNLVYSPLFKLDGNDIDWYLATGYEVSEDGKTYTFTLRDDVTWTDGEPFNADDVIFTLSAIEDPANASEMYGNFVSDEGAAELEKVDDYTVAVTFPDASPAHLEAFAYQVYILPEHIFADVADFDTYTVQTPSVTTGAYILTEYSAGSYLKFEKNDNYFKKTPSIGTIVYRIITSDDTASLAVQSGEVDAWATTPAYLSQIDTEKNNLTVYAFNQGRVGYMEVNAKTVTDENVRKAIFYGIDRGQLGLATYLNEDYYDSVYTFLPPNNGYYDDSDVERYETDLDKAKELLAEAGVSSLALTLGYDSTDSTSETWALLVQQQLSQIGITITLNPIESTAYSNNMREEDKPFDLFFGGYIMGSDPQTYSTLFTSGAAYNYSFAEIPEVDELFQKGITTFDETERAAIYKELQETIQDNAYFYPIASNNYLVLFNNRVGGIEDSGLVPIYTIKDAAYLTLNE